MLFLRYEVFYIKVRPRFKHFLKNTSLAINGFFVKILLKEKQNRKTAGHKKESKRNNEFQNR